ncbi:tetratricopeptide repeat protein [Enhygromyxa salina]|uniref:Tetratricopeptide repeat protein n=1 Tax=Enhygromyxa salina TaxID=215803 RepID=A0A2S9XN29_9BACT|nr:tetratricopeptide repeat protein [Enhygromyxa salina]PRP94277.1 Tetratricopeptide repeat protein [Enhygromyxa salina]
MSWNPPICHHCHASSTRFETTVPHGPPFAFGVGWICSVCRGRTLELCTVGPEPDDPSCCLNCGAAAVTASDEPRVPCRECGADHQLLVARVREHCGLPPCTEKIRALRASGLHRVAFNAVLLQLRANPDDPEALHTKAKLLVDVHRPEQALPLMRRVVSLGGSLDAQVDLGVALADSGHHQEAISIYERVLLADPHPPGRSVVLSNLGGCVSALGRPREAEGYHRRAIAADPEHPGPRWNLFANLQKQGRFADAIEVLEHLMELPSLDEDDREIMKALRSQLLNQLERN